MESRDKPSARAELARQFGPLTATKVLSFSLLGIGIAALLAAKFVRGIDGSQWAGIGLIAISLSFLADAILPGGTEFSDEQIVMMRHLGIPEVKHAAKILDLVVGVPLGLIGLYILS